ncbi:TPA: hypothetical protein EYP12_03595 [Candidatus Bipolaricaulota bacterium]|nr:hypothetical protein [Candidatus Bipolaricaulota bacterium]
MLSSKIRPAPVRSVFSLPPLALVLVLILIILLVLPGPTTYGSRSDRDWDRSLGGRSLARGGNCVAWADEVTIGACNPAGLALLEGLHLLFGLAPLAGPGGPGLSSGSGLGLGSGPQAPGPRRTPFGPVVLRLDYFEGWSGGLGLDSGRLNVDSISPSFPSWDQDQEGEGRPGPWAWAWMLSTELIFKGVFK